MAELPPEALVLKLICLTSRVSSPRRKATPFSAVLPTELPLNTVLPCEKSANGQSTNPVTSVYMVYILDQNSHYERL